MRLKLRSKKASRRIKRGKSFIKKLFSFILKNGVTIGVIVSLWVGISANSRTDLNTELSNRPYLGIIKKSSWGRKKNTDWFLYTNKVRNYGNKPAEYFKRRNYRVIVFAIDNEKIAQKIKESRTEVSSVEEYVIDERNRLRLGLLEELSKYFQSNPDVNKTSLWDFLKAENIMKQLRKNEIYFYKGKLLFNIIEVNNDMENYYKSNADVIFPNEDRKMEITQQIGQGGIEGVLEGTNLLVIYSAIKYQGFKKDKTYSTFSLGYYDRLDSGNQNIFKDDRGIEFYQLKEFQNWIEEDVEK